MSGGKLTYVAKPSKNKKNKNNNNGPEEVWKRNAKANTRAAVALPSHLEEQQRKIAEKANNREAVLLPSGCDNVDTRERFGRVRSLNDICLGIILCSIDMHLAVIETLPFFLRNQILSLSLQQGKLSLKQLKLLVHPEMERLDFSHARYRSRVNDLFLSPFVPHVPELPELDDWEEVTPTQLYVSPSGCTTLSYLSIAQCIHLSRDFIEASVKKFERLTELDLSGLDLKVLYGMTIESASLRCLRIRKPRNASSKILFSCNLRTPNLLVLCVAATTPALDKFFMERAPLLHTLDLSDCHFNSTINMSATMLLMRFLSSPQGRGITTLLLPNCNLNDATLNQIAALPELSLREINLAGNSGLSTTGILNFFTSAVCKNSLKKLDIAHCHVKMTLLYECWTQMLSERTETDAQADCVFKTWVV